MQTEGCILGGRLGLGMCMACAGSDWGSAQTDRTVKLGKLGKAVLQEWAEVLPECQDALQLKMWTQR